MMNEGLSNFGFGIPNWSKLCVSTSDSKFDFADRIDKHFNLTQLSEYGYQKKIEELEATFQVGQFDTFSDYVQKVTEYHKKETLWWTIDFVDLPDNHPVIRSSDGELIVLVVQVSAEWRNANVAKIKYPGSLQTNGRGKYWQPCESDVMDTHFAQNAKYRDRPFAFPVNEMIGELDIRPKLVSCGTRIACGKSI